MVAWLSDLITTGEQGLDFSKERRWRAKSRPFISASYTVCSVSGPKWYWREHFSRVDVEYGGSANTTLVSQAITVN